MPHLRTTPEAERLGLTREALAHLAVAVTAAEARTAAEIRVMVRAAPLVQHLFYPVLWAALAALVLPWLVEIAWRMPSLTLLALQAAIFVIAAAVMMIPAVAERVVPRAARKAAARAAAIELFLAHGIPQTQERTGILIFVAARDHLVEVVADDAVNDALGHEAWKAICAAIIVHALQGRLVDGIEAGVTRAADLLSGPLPPRPDDTNELDNHIVVL